MFQIYTMLYFVNNSKTNLENIQIRVEGIEKENCVRKLKAGAVESQFLAVGKYKGERDAFIYYIDDYGNKHEQKILEAFDMTKVTKFKIRISEVLDNGDLKFTVEEERY